MTPMSRIRDTYDVSGGFILIVLETLNSEKSGGWVLFYSPRENFGLIPTHPPALFYRSRNRIAVPLSTLSPSRSIIRPI